MSAELEAWRDRIVVVVLLNGETVSGFVKWWSSAGVTLEAPHDLEGVETFFPWGMVAEVTYDERRGRR